MTNLLRNVKIRTVGAVIVATLIVVGLGNVLVSAVTLRDVHSMVEAWRTYSRVPAAKTAALAELRRALGYDRTIHQFKNFVLRKDRIRLIKIQEGLLHVSAALTNYQSFGINENERAAIAALDDVLTQYANAVAVAEKMVSQGARSEEIDAAVRIDDRPAVEALAVLDQELLSARRATTEQVSSSLKKVMSVVITTEIVTSALLLFVLFGILWFVRWKLLSPLTRLGAVMQRLASGDRTTDVPVIGRQDEVGDMARVVQVFKDNLIELDRQTVIGQQAEKVLRESEERFRQIYENTPVMLHSIDKDARLISVSDYWLETLGYDREEVLGRKVYEFFSEKSRRHSKEETLPEFFRTGFAKDLPFQVVKKNGEVIDVLLTVMAVRDEQGKFIRSLAVMIDITERKQAEEALRASEEQFRGAVETLQEGFALYDAEDRLVLLNDEYRGLHPGAEDILVPGMHFEDLVRRNIERGTNADAIGREEEHIRERLEQHRDPKGPIVRRLTNGTWFIIKEARTPDGGIAVTETDITELKQAEEDLREARDNLEIRVEERTRELVDEIAERKQAERELEENRELLRVVFENTPVCLNLKDTEGRYIVLNKPYEEWLGRPAEEIIGKKASEFLGQEEEVENLTRAERQVLETGEVIQREVSVPRSDGTVYDRILIKFPVKSLDGSIAAIGTVAVDITERKRAEEALRVAHDELEYRVEQRTQELVSINVTLEKQITERKQAEEALRESEERFRVAFENAPIGVALITREGNRFQVNQALADFLGYTMEELTDTEMKSTAANLDDLNISMRLRQQVLDGKIETYRNERRYRHKQGHVVWGEISGSLLRNEDGEPEHFIAHTIDITERKEAEAQLIQASKLATLGEMASGIAHELNQPLCAVGMAAENSLISMEEGTFDTEFVRKKLRTIVGQRDRMAGIVNHMRLFSRRDTTAMELFNPVECVAGAAGLTDQQFRTSGIELKLNLPAACRNVCGHPVQLEQVVLNLLNNARDVILSAMESAGSGQSHPAPRVRISLVDDKRRKAVVISVADNGGGIPDQALERIFDPFFTTKKKGRGTGLGLSISYSIIDAMGGRLEAQNTDGGAEFRISVPAAVDGSGAVDRRSRKKKRKAGTRNRRSKLPRVLVVDDEELIAEELAECLQLKGYDVATAGSGLEALELHRSRPADIVITDLLMPEMDGNELIRRLRRTHPDLPIMLVTGHTTFGDEKESITDGASVVLKKPIALSELLGTLSNMVRF